MPQFGGEVSSAYGDEECNAEEEGETRCNDPEGSQLVVVPVSVVHSVHVIVVLCVHFVEFVACASN